MPRRAPIQARAGSHLNPETTVPVTGTGHGRRQHGSIDLSVCLYQGGGELNNFFYRREGLISLGLDVWEYIRTRVEYLEMVDHDTNTVYVITRAQAETHGRVYDAGIGPRFGIPIHHWGHFGPDWQPVADAKRGAS